jgi:hypothetical protein
VSGDAPYGVSATPRAFTSYDLLKLLALIAMTLDHIGGYLMPHIPELKVIGRAAAPIFCFLVGWNQRYRWRTTLLLAALAVSGLNFLHGAIFPLNILWVILFGRVLMQWLEHRARPEQPWIVALAALLWLPVMALVFDYATVGLLWMLWGRQQRIEPGGRASIIYAVTAFVGAVALMVVLIPLPLVAMVGGIIVLGLTMAWLQRFHLLTLSDERLMPLLALSRHALAYYVIHLVLIIGGALGLGIAPLSLKLY